MNSIIRHFLTALHRAALLAALAARLSQAATYTVTIKNDPGAGSLRQAITDAQTDAGAATAEACAAQTSSFVHLAKPSLI